MRSFSYAALGFCLALGLSSCSTAPASPAVTVDYDRTYNFSKVRKIAIQPIARDTVATMLISDQQIRRIDSALSEELQRRGFEVVKQNAEADMFLAWRFIYNGDATLSTYDPATSPTVQGTLYVNMVDPVMLQTKWRATFHTDLRDRPESPEAAEYRRQAAQEILAQFPPSG